MAIMRIIPISCSFEHCRAQLIISRVDKKLSYRRETARQLHKLGWLRDHAMH